jgi:general secretion pathway protein A
MSHNVSSMCQSHFGLTEAPFSIAPDPRYLYMSQCHQEALATLLFGVSADGGFVLLTGDVGAGKTTICRCLLEQIPEACDVAYIFNPKLTVVELLSTICDEFRIAYPPGNTSIKLFVDLINAYLLDAHAKGRRAVLIIDEAQNLSADVLEQMRLLTNLETHQRKLLQIILLGQPELATMLERPELRQLAQRIVARHHLGPLTRAEVKAYVRHRLEVSGAKRQLIPSSLMGKVYRLSGGVPRVINTLCDRALLGAYVQSKERVDRATLTQAAREVFPRQMAPRQNMLLVAGSALLVVSGILIAAALYQQNQRKPGVLAVRAAIAESTKPATPAIPVARVKATPNTGDLTASPAAPALSEIPATRMTTGHRIEDGEPRVALPTTLEWPADVPRSSSETLAHSALLRTWGAGYREGIDLCRQAASVGLSCRTARGGLDELRHLNRPAILNMRDNQGRDFYATLTRLGDKSATFSIGNNDMVVALNTLAFQWSGGYTLLWRLPPDEPRNILIGERGPSVEWLSKQLARTQGGEMETPKNPVFDDDLMRQVKQFQLAQGLVPDGIAGPQTLARLSSVADQAAPKLFTVHGEE